MKPLLAALTLALVASQTHAVEILSTDFDGRTVSGTTASNLTWNTNGVADPGDLSATHNLFDTPDAQNRFAVDRNLHNEGNWFAEIALAVGDDYIGLDTVTLDALIYNNAGALQADQRDLDLTIELLQGASVLDSDTVVNIYAGNGSATQPQAVSFDLSGNTLSRNSSYTLRLTAFGQGPGNNAGIDNLAVNGDFLVPEPLTATLIPLAVAPLILRRRRNA